MVKDEPVLEQDLLHATVAGGQQGLPLLDHRHVQLIVGHTTLTEEVIADEITAERHEQLFDLCVQSQCIALMPKLVNSLVGDDEVELSQPLRPRGLTEVALDKLNAIGQRAKSLRGQLVHGCREIESDVVESGMRAQQMLGKEARPRAKL